MDKYTLEYEHKGLDYWWVLIHNQSTAVVGRGIIGEMLWDSFLDLFTSNILDADAHLMTVGLVERKL